MESRQSFFCRCWQISLGVLKDRLYNAQFPSHVASASAPPPFPFQRIDVQAEPLPQAQIQTQVSKKSGEKEQLDESTTDVYAYFYCTNNSVS